MFLSNRDIKSAIDDGKLIVKPLYENSIKETSIDLHLDCIDQAMVWNIDKLKEHNIDHGWPERELQISRIKYGSISREYLIQPPREKDAGEATVFRRDNQIVLKPHGFVLWQTAEVVGTPEIDPELICFIDGKSTRARTGLVVHLTAPTIHAGWNGNITLEMANFGPFDIVLNEDDSVAQIVVSRITSVPDLSQSTSATQGQTSVTGAPLK